MAALASLFLILCGARPAEAGCNVIPAAERTFRGTLGQLSRPFASPGDWVEVTLNSRCDADASPGFEGSTGDHVVTIAYRPPRGPRSLVVLAENCAPIEAQLAACTGTAEQPITRRRCIEVNGPGRAPGLLRTDLRKLGFRFPDTDGLVGTDSDDLTLTGPAVVAVTRAGDPIACDVAVSGCTRRTGLLACVDGLYENDGTCGTALGTTFASFTALPPPNAYSRICTDPPGPCAPQADRAIRYAIDAAGNLLVPMDWRDIQEAKADGDVGIPVPIARQLRFAANLRGEGDVPVSLPDPTLVPDLLTSYAPNGARIAPIFDPQRDTTSPGLTTLFGTTDAPASVLRVARCPAGECLFDLSGRLADDVGPGVIATADIVTAVALDPVPLDGLNQTATLNAFVREEGIGGEDLNGDGDATDHVVRLEDRSDGRAQRFAGIGGKGRAVARIRDGRFSFPALATSGDVIAFLEPESAQGYVDRNENGQVFEQILRVFRRRDGEGLARDLLKGQNVVADGAPRIDGRSVVVSGSRVFFHVKESDRARRETTLVSASSPGGVGNDYICCPSISSDGQVVAFESGASNLVFGDTNEGIDVFVHDREMGKTTRVSVSSAGEQANGGLFGDPAISSDGRFVAFASFASNLVPHDTNARTDVFVHDRQTGETLRSSVSSDGVQAQGGDSRISSTALSADGRFVTFESEATNLVPGDSNASGDVFVHDRQTGQTNRISVSSTGEQGSLSSSSPAISADGRFVAFDSLASNLVRGDSNDSVDVFVHDRLTGETARVSVSSSGDQGNSSSFSYSISSDGRFVGFSSFASNLVSDDGNGKDDVFVHDRQTGETTRVSVSSTGDQGNSYSGGALISANGRFVAFESFASNLVSGDTNGTVDVFVHDRRTGETTRVSVSSAGEQLDGVPLGSFTPSISADGRTVAFLRGSTLLFPLGLSPGDASDACDTGVADSQNGNCTGVFIRGPSGVMSRREYADLSGDGDGADEMLSAVNLSLAELSTLCPSSASSTSAGRVAFLRPESAGVAPKPGICPDGTVVGGKPDLNGDGDTADGVLQFWDGSGPVVNLALAATSLVMSGHWLAALVPERAQLGAASFGSGRLNGDADSDDDIAFVCPVPGGACQNLKRAASRIAIGGSVVAFTVPEVAEGQGSLNGDGDTDDDVLEVLELPSSPSEPLATPLSLKKQAEDFVVGPTGVVAFRTSERKQGPRGLNRDGDRKDSVMQLWLPELANSLNTHMAARACTFEACDPRLPYRVTDATVTFLTLECSQGGDVTAGCPSGGTDLNKDGDAGDLVLQTLNVAEVLGGIAERSAASAMSFSEDALDEVIAEAAQNATGVLGAVSAGVCTTTADACVEDADCPGGKCFVPPGGCIRDLGTSCDPKANRGDPGSCVREQFCSPTGPSSGTCRQLEGPCASTSDCSTGAICNDTGQSIVRLADPLRPASDTDPSAVFVGAGTCVEDLLRSCTVGAKPGEAGACEPGERCEKSAGGAPSCHREQGPCRPCEASDTSCTACPADAECRAELVARTAADTDHDGLPDALDDCPSVSNVEQEDGDADGVGDACEALCDGGVVLRRARIKVSNVGEPAGDERIVLTGRLQLPEAVASSTLQSLVASGLEIELEDHGNASARTVLELSRRTAALPGFASVGCGGDDGWTADAALPGVSYRNSTGALPGASCAAGSADGLVRLELIDRRATTPGRIDVSATFTSASLARPVGPLRATVVLGVGSFAGAGNGAPCATTRFTAKRCKASATGAGFTCRS